MKQRVLRIYTTASALVTSSLAFAGQVHAQEEAKPDAPASTEPAPVVEPAPAPEAPPVAESTPAPAAAPAPVANGAAPVDAKVDVGVKLAGSASTPAAGAETDVKQPAPGAPPPRYGNANEWRLDPYGQIKFDAIRDSTESFFDAQQPYSIARAGTYKGDHARTIFVAKDSRLGLNVGAPEFAGIKSYGKLEVDFFGLAPTDAKENDLLVMGPVRIRQGFVRLDNSVVDVLAGQTQDLFGWGGYFYPATVAFLGVPGEIYHRNPQFRLEKKLDLGKFEITAAAAAVRPGQRDAGIPDVQGGLRVAFDGWKGAAMSGFSTPSIVPISVGVSGMYRWFEMPAFRSNPGSEGVKENGYGIAVSAMLPVIPASSVEDRGNALTLTGEFSTGTGDADMYSGMDGGSRLPLLPNPGLGHPEQVYPANIDPGLATFDRTWSLKTINWQAFVAGVQYYLPIAKGRVWVSGVYSQVKSDNLKELTPLESWGAIFPKMQYFDVSTGVAITPALQLGLSFQTLKQTFGDVSQPTAIFGQSAMDGVQNQLSVAGTGGVPATARNNRAQVTMALFF